jgi:glycosyltransferase involved in cell wall biosynthesis
MTGIFVGSTIHKEQLRSAGWTAPIHVVSLPFDKQATLRKLTTIPVDKQDVIVYSSRLDKEKNPFFMMAVAEEFLQRHPTYEWHVTTSGKTFRSMMPDVIQSMQELALRQPRFKLLSGLTKEEYYTELATCKIQFNSSLQDYVSWTVIESTTFGADIVFPNFRSFPEFIDNDRLYVPFNQKLAVQAIEHAISNPKTHSYISDISDLGRRMEAYIIANQYPYEICIWHERELCEALIAAAHSKETKI